MRKKNFIFLILCIMLVSAGIKEARAEITLTDCLSVTGYFRYELALHTGAKNPNNFLQTQNNDFNFSRTYFLTEWTYKPSEQFKLVAKVRVMGDQTQDMDYALGHYKAFPVDVPKYDWTMLRMGGKSDEFRAEVNELYTDLSFGDLWVRMGKQQIVWGEMIATRIMDVINPLDMSRNLRFEPEEFDNIRIPEWSIRGRYQFGNVGPLSEFMLEGFVNPGDVQPTQYADFGSPFYAGNGIESFPSFFRMTDKDRRGKTEYGFRTGGMIKSFYFTLNYLSLYNDEMLLKATGIMPDPIHGIPIFAPADWTLYDLLFDKKYPSTNIFGLTCNYFIAPLNTVATFETTWVPDQPYGDARVYAAGGAGIRDQGTWSYAIRFDRPTFVFPRPISAMTIQLQYSQTVREGNPDWILGPANSKVDQTDNFITLQLSQYFLHNNLSVNLLFVQDLRDATLFKPLVTYRHGDHWIFDLYTVYTAGAEKRPTRFGNSDWVNQTVGRITYQF